MIGLPKFSPLNLFISIILREYFTTSTCFWLFDQNHEVLTNFNQDYYILNDNNDKNLSNININKFHCRNFVVQSDYPLKMFEIIESMLMKATETKYYNR